MRRAFGGATVFLLLLAICQTTAAGPWRDRIIERRLDRAMARQEADNPVILPAEVRIIRDVRYGSDKRQRFDVYTSDRAQNAPVIFMVHGGGWRIGDKAMRSVVENKAARWVPKGFVFISANYRMLPEADPLEQARDVARAVAKAQRQAADWGGDPAKFILMGHSAGAHLVALLDTKPSLAAGIVTSPWLGTVALDSAALNVVKIMEGRHLRLYDNAFGRDPAYWKAASPFFALNSSARPLLAVCSTRRENSCGQAKDFAAKAAATAVSTMVLPEDMNHLEINKLLGKEQPYTDRVESFMAGLDKTAAKLLHNTGD